MATSTTTGEVYFKLSGTDVKAPAKSTPGSAGFDLFSPKHFQLGPGELIKLDMQFAVTPPPGHYCQILSKSGVASNGVLIMGGVIDPDFTGSVQLIMKNLHNSIGIFFQKNQKLAQLLLMKICQNENVVILEEGQHLPSENKENRRRGGGFGSTGIF